MSTGYFSNIENLASDPGFHFMEHDITVPIDIEADQIYNLACPASPAHYQEDPVKTLLTSTQGALNMLNLARKYNAKILQASTSEIYGNPLVHPQKEDYWGNVNPVGVRACYDEGKRLAETLFTNYRQQYGVRTKIVRLFNTYGPKLHPGDGRAVSNFILPALQGMDITVYGDGLQTRSLCYADDTIDGLIRMMNCPDEDFAGPVNIGNPTEMTMLELAYRIIRLTRSSSSVIYCRLPQDDPVRRKPDISLAKEKLGWAPRTGIDEGLMRTIGYYRELIP